MKSAITIALALSAVLFGGCSREERVEPQAPQVDPRIEQARMAAQRRSEFKASMDQRVAEIDGMLDDVRQRRGASSSDPTLSQLNAKRGELEAAVTRVNSAADDSSWNAAATDFDATYADLSDKLAKERADYKSSISMRLADLDRKIEDARSRRGDPASDPTLAQIVQKRRELDEAAMRVRDSGDSTWKDATAAFERGYQDLSTRIGQERSEYVAAINQRIADLDRRVADLLSRPGKTSKATMAQIDDARRELNSAADRARNATDSNWKEATTDLEQRFRDLKDLVDKGARPKK